MLLHLLRDKFFKCIHSKTVWQSLALAELIFLAIIQWLRRLFQRSRALPRLSYELLWACECLGHDPLPPPRSRVKLPAAPAQHPLAQIEDCPLSCCPEDSAQLLVHVVHLVPLINEISSRPSVMMFSCLAVPPPLLLICSMPAATPAEPPDAPLAIAACCLRPVT